MTKLGTEYKSMKDKEFDCGLFDFVMERAVHHTESSKEDLFSYNYHPFNLARRKAIYRVLYDCGYTFKEIANLLNQNYAAVARHASLRNKASRGSKGVVYERLYNKLMDDVTKWANAT